MIFRWLAEFVANLIPDFNMAPEQIHGFITVVDYVNVVAYYIPVGTFFLCLTSYFTVWIGCAITSAILQLL